jgi:MarR family transcriptional regulator for hemolysin
MTTTPKATSNLEQAPRELSRMIGTVSQKWRQQMNQRLKPFGLNLSMRQVLLQLHRHPEGLMQRDLAERLGIEGPTLVRLLDLLEQKEWIRRISAADDKRRKFAVLSAKASKQIQIIEKQSEELRQRMLAGLSPIEIETGLGLMRRMQNNLLQP